MKYVMIYHANLNYAYLTPDNYEFVIREAYEMTIDTMRKQFPGTKYVFEASGYTVEMMEKYAPAVVEKLKAAIADGSCEFMGSPYAHPMLPNFPEKDCAWSLEFSHRIYDEVLGMRPVSFWNPECGWRDYVPRMIKNAGYKYLAGDFESYSRCENGPNGGPQRPEIYAKEATKEKNFYNFDFKYDLPADDYALHYPFNHVHDLGEDELRVFLRSDRVCQYAVRYFMGMEGYSHEDYLKTIDRYSGDREGQGEGALVIFADDAEYIGTNGWFRLKYQNEPDRVFEKVPDAQEKLIALVTAVKERGEFITFAEACKLAPNTQPITWDDDAAWHGARASTWASTPMARMLRPWQDLIREKLNLIEADLPVLVSERIWYHLTNSYNSDGQWPPTLPHAPHIIHPFNYAYCYENLLTAHHLVGGVDFEGLDSDAAETLGEVVDMQSRLILKKAKKLQAGGTEAEKADAVLAERLLAVAIEKESVRGRKTLDAGEYMVRADAMVEARRLVGGIVIEKAEAPVDVQSSAPETVCQRAGWSGVTNMKKRILSLVALGFLSVQMGLAASPEAQPNILLMLADDLGYRDLSCFGGTAVQTPNLDRLAKQGTTFTHFYSASAVCTPTRASVLTGRYPLRFNITRHFNDIDGFLPEAATTVAEVLRDAGYTTIHVGKWHLGGLHVDESGRRLTDQPGPRQHGFETYQTQIEQQPLRTAMGKGRTIYRKGGTVLLRNDQRVGADDPYYPKHLTEANGDFALQRIEECAAANKPFFLNLWWLVPHAPYEPAPEPYWSETAADGISEDQHCFRSMVRHMDAKVGQILAKLDEFGLATNTLVLFTSDNGAAYEGNIGELKGGKTDLHDGGTRVPMFVRWPGKIPAGRETDAFGSTIDLLPTLCEVAGVALPGDLSVDGTSLLPHMTGGAAPDWAQRGTVFWQLDLYKQIQRHYPKPKPYATEVVRSGKWKMLSRQGIPVELFNIDADPNEKRNLLSRHPERATAMAGQVRAWLAEKRITDGVIAKSSEEN